MGHVSMSDSYAGGSRLATAAVRRFESNSAHRAVVAREISKSAATSPVLQQVQRATCAIEDLLQLPQETYIVSDDSNFHGKTEISGIALSTLAQTLGQSADMIVAICYDHYRTNYPADYLRAHHPLLVLRINGQDRDHWPAADNGGVDGPVPDLASGIQAVLQSALA